MSCVDCIHYGICKIATPEHILIECDEFKNKRDFQIDTPPCKLGDTLWQISKITGEISKEKVCGISFDCESGLEIELRSGITVSPDDFNKTIFLDPKEAETVLSVAQNEKRRFD